jgi:hypothetical protein
VHPSFLDSIGESVVSLPPIDDGKYVLENYLSGLTAYCQIIYNFAMLSGRRHSCRNSPLQEWLYLQMRS